ncbi:MAG: PP2C family protein-serine/threonine phosphatase, partial [bacterium]|nr:PP2C family protein-serine/threonine phosphatase [bacterium]
LIFVLSKEKNCFCLAARQGYRDPEDQKKKEGPETFREEEAISQPEVLFRLEHNQPVMAWLEEHLDVLEKEQIEVNPYYQTLKKDALSWFDLTQLDLLVPIIYENRIYALLGLGKKESLRSYTINDTRILKKLGAEIGVTVFNALHHLDLVEKERIEEELKMGRHIQLALLPQGTPSISGLKVTGLMQPAREIGGDYYDFINLSEEEKAAIIIGDVSGKGVAAGLCMAMVKTSVQIYANKERSPKQILLNVNYILNKHIGGEKFMTMLYLVWEPKTSKITYASAGHEHILIYKQKKKVLDVIQSGGTLLGISPDIEALLEDRAILLESGDKVLLYTDGATEAHNSVKERFGLERLKTVFKEQSDRPIDFIIDRIRKEIFEFISTCPQYDDITLVGLEKT